MRERIVRIVAGTLVLTSLMLALTVNIRWLALAAFVAFNLFQSALTGFCPLELILARFGVPSANTTGSCDRCEEISLFSGKEMSRNAR